MSAAVSLYGGVALLVLIQTRRWWRWLALVAALIVVGLVCWARLYLGVHYPTDIIGSIPLAVPWLAACRYTIQPGADTD